VVVDLINHPTRRPQKPWTPELDKRHVVIESGHAQVLGEFLDHLRSHEKYVLARYDEDSRLYPVHVHEEAVLAGFFDLDLNRIEREKMALLRYMRACHQYDDDRQKRAERAVAQLRAWRAEGVDG
jgi:hypothetical protein